MEFKQRDAREKCYAKVIFLEEGVPGYVRDISESGIKIDILQAIPWSKGDIISVRIIPTEELNIETFLCSVEIRWLQKGDPFNSLGAEVKDFEGVDSREKYNSLLGYYTSKN